MQNRTILFIQAILFVYFVSFTSAFAQSLIVGIPSAEVVPKGRLLVAQESQFNWWEKDNVFRWTGFGFSCYGLTETTELCVTGFNFSRPRSGNRTIAAGFKSSIPVLRQHDLKKWEFTLSGGAMVPVSLDGKGAGYWLYGNGSLRIPETRTRLTAGPSYGTRQIFGRDVFSWTVGYEQPISKHFALVGDWYSGTHDIAAYIAAVQYDYNDHLVIIGGYKIPNNAVSGPHALMIEITYEFE